MAEVAPVRTRAGTDVPPRAPAPRRLWGKARPRRPTQTGQPPTPRAPSPAGHDLARGSRTRGTATNAHVPIEKGAAFRSWWAGAAPGSRRPSEGRGPALPRVRGVLQTFSAAQAPTAALQTREEARGWTSRCRARGVLPRFASHAEDTVSSWGFGPGSRFPRLISGPLSR